MLRLVTQDPKPEKLAVGSGATLTLRPATSLEVYRVEEEIAVLTRGLVDGSEALTRIHEILGLTDLDRSDLTKGSWIAAIARRLGTIKLAAACVTAWDGIGDENGNPLELNESNLALLLRDPGIAERVSSVINRRIHIEAAEGNGSAASPNGAAAAGEPIAPTAEQPDSRALTES